MIDPRDYGRYGAAVRQAGGIPESNLKNQRSHYVFAAGEVTTAGGDATETATVAGALATDIVIANVQTEGSSPATLDAVAVTANTVTATFSADPSTDHVWSYVIYRAVA